MANSDYKEHISSAERSKWSTHYDTYYNDHLGKGGTNNHSLATGSVAGFSQSNFTPTEKTKLAGIEDGALNNPHPATHPYTMITGLATVAHTGVYSDLTGRPVFPSAADGCNAATVDGIRITIGANAPSSPVNSKEIWMDTTNKLIKIYYGSTWVSMRAVWD